MIRIEPIGNATLYLGDCREIIPNLSDIDAVLTDPPYGIGADRGKKLSRPFKTSRHVSSSHYPSNSWDNERPSKEVFDLILQKSKRQIIWGGNYFADLLPPRGRWLWWDKCQTMPTYGDGELAWTNLDGTTPKKFILSNNKITANCREGKSERLHPTQKPIELMNWCIGLLGDVQIILDPFMGCGTTGAAALRLGYKFIGIEIQLAYFDVACRRLEETIRQADLFIESKEEAAAVQLSFGN